MNQKTKDIINELLDTISDGVSLSDDEKEAYLKYVEYMYSRKEIVDIRDSLPSPEELGRRFDNE